jgi:hypothetical protein
MSAQGGTLQRRGTIELPILPVAILVVAALAAAIGMTLLRDAGQTTFVTSVTDSERFANSTAAVREQGAVAPTIDLTNSGVAIRHRGFAIRPSLDPTTAFREQGAVLPSVWGVSHVTPTAIREQGAVLPTTWGVSHMTPSVHSVSATYGTGWDSIGGQNEALHRQYSPRQETSALETVGNGILVNGELCGQCR